MPGSFGKNPSRLECRDAQGLSGVRRNLVEPFFMKARSILLTIASKRMHSPILWIHLLVSSGFQEIHLQQRHSAHTSLVISGKPTTTISLHPLAKQGYHLEQCMDITSVNFDSEFLLTSRYDESTQDKKKRQCKRAKCVCENDIPSQCADKSK